MAFTKTEEAVWFIFGDDFCKRKMLLETVACEEIAKSEDSLLCGALTN